MLTFCAAAIIVLISSAALAADATIAEVVSISNPGSWRLYIRDDGSANLR